VVRAAARCASAALSDDLPPQLNAER
jgi:hypothetical protein